VQDEGRIVHYNIQAPTGMFRLIQVHPYSPVTPTRHLGRNKALASLAEVEITLPVVITGDFNTVPWQRNIRQLMERFDLKMAGLPKPTFPAYQMVLGGQRWYLPPLLPLDYVLVPNAARVLASEARYVPATDHFGVVADIILPPLH